MYIGKRAALGLLVIILNLLYSAVAETKSDIAIIYTSYFPPIVSEDKKMRGFAYEIVQRVLEISNIKYKIIHYPWARSQEITKKTPEALIFPLTRTKTRESSYDWSFKIFKTQTHFVTVNGEKLTKESARKKQIGVQRKSSWDNWLIENNYTNVKRLESEQDQLSKMLLMGRIDALFVERSVAEKNLRNNKKIKITYSDPIVKFDTYFATNKQVPYRNMKVLKNSFLKLIDSGEYEKILKKYQVSSKKVNRNNI